LFNQLVTALFQTRGAGMRSGFAHLPKSDECKSLQMRSFVHKAATAWSDKWQKPADRTAD